MHGLFHGSHVRYCHGVGLHLCSSGVVLKRKQRVIGTGAATPEVKATLVDQRRDFVAIEVVGVGGRVLQVPERIGTDTGDAIYRDVGKGFVPAGFLIDLGA